MSEQPTEPTIRRCVVRHKSGGGVEYLAVVLESTFDGEPKPYLAFYEASGNRSWWTMGCPSSWPELTPSEISANPAWAKWVYPPRSELASGFIDQIEDLKSELAAAQQTIELQRKEIESIAKVLEPNYSNDMLLVDECIIAAQQLQQHVADLSEEFEKSEAEVIKRGQTIAEKEAEIEKAEQFNARKTERDNELWKAQLAQRDAEIAELRRVLSDMPSYLVGHGNAYVFSHSVGECELPDEAAEVKGWFIRRNQALQPQVNA